jgi:copper chaperone CopZ
MPLKSLEILGMSCGHCVKAVTMALQDLPGVTVKDVRVGQALIDADDDVVTPADLSMAIEEAGFTLESVGAG